MRVGEGEYPHNPTLRVISAGRRRWILNFLLGRDSPTTEQELVEWLGATEGGAPVTAGQTAEPDPVHAYLTHDDLPALETAGLIEWDRDAETVEVTSHPALDDPRFRKLLRIEPEGLDAVLSGLSHEHRRIVLTVLMEARASVTPTDLAEEIRRRETELAGRTPPSFDDLMSSLHHHHLPKLDDVALIEYDPDAGRATYSENTALETVFDIIYEPSERVVDQLDEFLGDLQESYRPVSRDAGEQLEWPHFWKEPSRG